MRFTRLIPVLAVPMLVAGCDQNDPTAPDPPQLGVQAASIPKVEFPIFDQFDHTNPCTGLSHIITITGTGWWQEHNNNGVLRVNTTTTTSDGFEGRGNTRHVEALNGGIWKETIHDMLTHPSGAKFRVHLVSLWDFRNWPPTLRLDIGGTTCVRP